MFSQTINNAFTSDVADELFPHIKGEDYRGDKSFVATARVLLTPHIPADFDGDINIMYQSIDGHVYDDGSIKLGEIPLGENYLCIVDITGEDSTGGSRRKALIDTFLATNPGHVYDEKLTVFFEQTIKFMTVFAFVNRETHNTICYIEQMNNRKNHAIQSMLPRLTPWWWEGTSPSPEERVLLHSLASRFVDKVQTGSGDAVEVSDGYSVLMQKYEPLYDFRGAKIRRYLPAFMKKIAEGELERVTNELQSIDARVIDCEREISGLMNQRREQEIRFLGLQIKAEQEADNTLAEYFSASPCLDLVTVEGSSLTFCVYTTLDWWDDELAPRFVDNKESDMYSKTGGIRKDDYQKLLRAVFVDRTMHIRVCGAYRMDIGSNEMYGVSRFGSFRDRSWLPNAHIQNHGCTGNYKQQFRDALRHGDYPLALDIAIASAKSMNFNDISFQEFMRSWPEYKDSKIFQDDDGVQYTAQEAIKRIKTLEKEAKK